MLTIDEDSTESQPKANPRLVTVRVVFAAAPGYSGTLTIVSSWKFARPKKVWLELARKSARPMYVLKALFSGAANR